jgi:hypothetical protein
MKYSIDMKVKQAWWLKPILIVSKVFKSKKPLQLFSNFTVFTFYFNGKRGNKILLKQLIKKV